MKVLRAPLVLLLLGLGLFWALRHPLADLAQAPAPSPRAQAVNPSEPPSFREEKAPVAAPSAQSATVPTAESTHHGLLATGRVLAERATPPNPEGLYEKTRLLEDRARKYPYVRAEEVWRRDPATGRDTLERRTLMVGDHLMVKLASGSTSADLVAILDRLGVKQRRQVGKNNLYLVSTAGVGLDEYEVTRDLLRGSGPALVYVEPDYLVHPLLTPNDPSFGQLWGLNNLGQTGGVGDADIDAPEAWDVTRGSANVTVGVIDTGIDYQHPDLVANIWTNLGEIPGNNIDDDNNGYVDDVHGWDFLNNDQNPDDDHYHGTHCAGTIGAVGDNGVGVAGVSHTVKLMALKFLGSYGGYTSDAVEAVHYATDNGAHITSNSWGGGGYSQALKDAIDDAARAGVLFVAAAGNSSADNDVFGQYPSSYLSPNILAVAATDHADRLATFSSYGAVSVHLAAPGVNVYSTAPGGAYRHLSGTSMATPHVAGAAALLLAIRPDWNWAELKDALLAGVDPVPALSGKVSTGGRLNVARALLLNNGPYLAISSLGLHDSPAEGGAGNGDGIASPGEDLALRIRIRNTGSGPAVGAVSTVTVSEGAGPVTIIDGAQSWGDLAVGQTRDNHTAPLRLRVSAGAVTPHPFTITLLTTDSAGGRWRSEASFVVRTVSTVRGRVLVLTGSAPLVGAVVAYEGASSGQVVTDATGGYSLSLPEGDYSLSASKASYNTSPSVALRLPPENLALDFNLGRSRLQVTPAAISSTQLENARTTHLLTLANTGDQTLTVTLSDSVLASASLGAITGAPSDALAGLGVATISERPFDPTPVSDANAILTALPLEDDFEDGTLDGWTSGYGAGERGIVSTSAANGARSFRFRNTGDNAHYNGIQSALSAGSRPRHVSFWMRPGSATEAAGYFVLGDLVGETITFFAKENGRFYVNGDVGGDNSYAYHAGAWYHVEFRNIDWANRRFDYHVNGSVVKTAIPFRRASTEIRRVSLYNFSSGAEAWWDDIRLLDQQAGWLGYTPRNLSLAPGAEAEVQVTLDSTDLAAATYQARLDLQSNDPLSPRTTVPVTLVVEPEPNTPPVALAQTVSLDEDTQTVVTLAGSDAENHPLTAVVASLPASGTLYQTSDGASLGTALTTVPAGVTDASRRLIYVPAPNAHGTPLASFSFYLRDRRSQSAQATVTLNVASVNDVPLARDDQAGAAPGDVIASIAVRGNDTDADGDTLTITAFTQGARGVVSPNPDGTLRYAPSVDFVSGADQFTYTVSDGRGAIATARVHITVGNLSAGGWPMMGGNPAHSGYYPAGIGSGNFIATWTLPFGRALNQASIAGGRVFVTPSIYFNETHVTAVRLDTGTVEWRKDFTTARSLTGPSFHDGTLYLQRGNHSSDSQLWAVDATTGATRWSSPFSAQWGTYHPPTVIDSAVYVNGGYYGGVYGYARPTGSQLFFQTLPQEDGWTPAYADGVVYTFVRGIFTAHHPTTGAARWTVNVKPDTSSYSGGTATVAIADGRAYFVARPATGAELVCVNLATRAVAWRVAATYFQGTPAVSGDTVYVIDGTAVRAYRTSDGAVVGAFSTGTENASYQPIVTNDALIAANANRVWIWDLSTRNLRQTLTPGGIVSVSDGNLVVAGSAGVLACYGVTGPGRTPPVASPQTITGTEDQPLVISLDGTDADGDSLSAIITTLPTLGALYQTGDGVTPGAPILTVPATVTHPLRKVVYRPLPDDFGLSRATFAFRVRDSVFNSPSATVTIHLDGVNDAPRAVNDRYRLRPGFSLGSVNPAANDIDVDGDTLTIVSTTPPSRGALVSNADGTLGYTPDADFVSGSDSFTYTVGDALGVTSTATVELAVANSFRADWPTHGGSPAHSGYYLGTLGVTPFTELWSYPVGTALNAPVVADGRLYFTIKGNWSGYMHAVALDSATGAEAWRAEFQPGNSLNPPTWFNGKIYLQRGNHSSDSHLHALDAATGAELWKTPFAAQWERYLAPAADATGIYVNGGSYGGLYGFHPDTGAQKFFNSSLEQYDQWTPSLEGDDGLYSFIMGKFRAHDRVTGAILWTIDLGWNWGGYSMHRTIACADGFAYLINDRVGGGQELVAINLATRTIKWRIAGSFRGTPAISNGLLYVASNGRVRGYNSGSGLLLREYIAPGESSLLAPPIVTDDLLVVASSTKTYLFNLATRALVQTLPVAGEVAIANDEIFLAGSDNIIRRYGRNPVGNQTPVADAIRLGIREEASVAIRLTGTDADGDALRFAIRSLPVRGRLYQTPDGAAKGALITTAPALVSHSSGTVLYEAPLDVFGDAAAGFTYVAHDYAAASAAATVTIDISPVNDAPVAQPDTVALRPGEVLSNFRPEANDLDPDGDVLRVTDFTQPAHGTLVRSADGTLQYTPHEDYIEGDDSFDYTVSDPAGLASSSTVRLIVSATRGRDWPMFGAGPDHAGYLPLYLGSSLFTQRWSNNLGFNLKPASIAANRVYVGNTYSGASRLTALDAGAGSEIWRVEYTGYSINQAAYHDDDVIVQAGNNYNSRLFVVRAPTGAAVWSAPFSAQWEQYLAPTVDATGIYINGGTYGGLYKFHRDTGAQSFFLGLEQLDHWTPLRHQNGLYTYVSGRVRRHDSDTGAILGTLDLTTSSTSTMGRTIAADAGVGYLVNYAVTVPAGGRDLVAIDLATLTVRWTVRDPAFRGTPAVANGVVYVLTDGSIRAHSTTDGRLLLTYLAPGETDLATQPIVTNDSLVAYSATKTYVFDLATAALRQTIPHGGAVSLAGDSLYIAGSDNHVRAFGIPDALNRPPVAQSATLRTDEDTPVAIRLDATDADGHPTTGSITRLPAQGTLHWTADGITPGAVITQTPALVGTTPTRVIYMPPLDVVGDHLGDFRFAASDGRSLSAEADITVHVTPVNDAPVAEDDSRVIQPGQILSPLREIANDLDVDGDALTVVSFTQPAAGLVVRNHDGTLRFHPPLNAASGSYQFTYTVADAADVRDNATVTITISDKIEGAWPTQGGAGTRAGYAPLTLGHSAYALRWSRPVGTSLTAAAVGDGNVFVSATIGSSPTLVALDERTGSPKWQRPFASAFSLNPPTHHQGIVYVQRGNHSGDTQLWAISALSGAPIWSGSHAAQWERYLAPLVLDDGVFVNGGSYGGLYGFNRGAGTQRFFRSMAQVDGWTPAASPAGELLSFVSGVVTRHHIATGATEWSLNLGWGGYGYTMNRTIAVEDRRAFIINDSPSAAYSDEDLVAIDLDTHAPLWSINGEFTGTPSVAQGVVYAISGATVQARSSSTGRLLAVYPAANGEGLAGQPVVTEDLVIVASAQRTYLFSRHDRALIQVLPVGGSVSVADDQIIVASPATGVLSAYATQPAISFTPAGGTFTGPVAIVLGAREPGARIHYTLDGSAPDFDSPWVASGASVTMQWTGKVRAIMVHGTAVSRINEISITMQDLDGDGIPDWWENTRFGGLASTDATIDTDGDGHVDRDEFLAGTDPFDGGDQFTVHDTRLIDSGLLSLGETSRRLSISWSSKSDRYYIVESSDNLNSWQAASLPLVGTGASITHTHESPPDGRLFLRVRVLPLLIEATP